VPDMRPEMNFSWPSFSWLGAGFGKDLCVLCCGAPAALGIALLETPKFPNANESEGMMLSSAGSLTFCAGPEAAFGASALPAGAFTVAGFCALVCAGSLLPRKGGFFACAFCCGPGFDCTACDGLPGSMR